MKKGWEKKKLIEICGFVRGPFGGSLKKSIFKPDGYAVYEQQHAIYDQFDDVRYYIDEAKFKEMRRFELNSGDIVMSCSGTMGKIAIVPDNIKKGIINQALLKLTPSKSISTVYLKLWMQSESFQESLREHSGGAAIQNVASVAILKQIEIPLPPLPEQQKIVTLLDKCFQSIDRAKAIAEKNLQNAKELFESYLNGVFEKGKDVWEEKTLEEVCDFRNGAAHEQHIDEDGKYILVNSKFISADGEKFKKTNSALAPLFVDDIAFVMSDVPDGKALAKCFLVDKNDTYTLNQRIGAIKSKVFVSKFLVYQFNRNRYLLSFNNGENQTNLRKGDILKCPLWVPPKTEQQIIINNLDTLRAETKKLEVLYQQKIEDLEELKKSILQKAFNGELNTENIDI